MFIWWKNLSVAKKLYGVVGLMALLIAIELFTLLFAMNTLSAVRALVGGEGMWSKAQKDGIHSLQKYVITRDESFLDQFNRHMKVPMGDRQARLEMEKSDMDYNVVFQGFVAGKVYPNDVPGIISLLRRFHENSYLKKAITEWKKGDQIMFDMIFISERIRSSFKQNEAMTPAQIKQVLEEISVLNGQFTLVADSFSTTLGEASRWLEDILMMLLILAVVTVESVGLFLTITFTRGLSFTLNQLTGVAQKVGAGDFTQLVPVNSRDELGQLAEAINSMTVNLRHEAHQRQQAEQASHAKNLFLANMSHEIRTPLNAILGFSELLRDSELSENEKKSYLDVIKRTGLNLATIINDILDVTKIEADQMKVEMIPFSLPLMIQDLRALLTLRTEEKGLHLKIEKKGEVSEFIRSDSVRLRQILINIIGNAIKYTEKGLIHVTYEVMDNQLCFTVKDTGKGIPEAHKSLLFQPFSQGDSSIQKKYGGTGLGLLLSKKLSQLLGGDVILKSSDVLSGSTFYVCIGYEPVLQLAATKETITRPRSSGQLKLPPGTRILIVEDTVDSQMLLKLYLAKSGAHIDVANDGAEGVEKAMQENYDLILMDMQMPVMDGYLATETLRKMGNQTSIVALTAFAMRGDRDKSIQSGCTDYISKPIDKEVLFNVVDRLINHKS